MKKYYAYRCGRKFTCLAIVAFLIGLVTAQALLSIRGAQSILTLKWTKSNLGSGFWEGGVVIGDVIQSNPGEEIVFATDYNRGTVWCLDDYDGRTLWTYSDSAIYAYAQVSLYDVDGDGKLEVLVPLYYPPGVFCLRGDGTIYWRTTISGSSGTIMSSLAAVDVDGDGKLEVFAGSQNIEAGSDKKFSGKNIKLSHDG